MMKNRIIPVTISAILSLSRRLVAICPEPRCKNTMRNDVSIITIGLNFASHDTMIAVNPLPPAVFFVIV